MLLWHVLVPMVCIPRMPVTRSRLAGLLCSHWVSWARETPPSATDDDTLLSCLTSSSSSPMASTHTYTFPHVCTIYILLKLYQVSRTRIWKKKHDGWGCLSPLLDRSPLSRIVTCCRHELCHVWDLGHMLCQVMCAGCREVGHVSQSCDLKERFIRLRRFVHSVYVLLPVATTKEGFVGW